MRLRALGVAPGHGRLNWEPAMSITSNFSLSTVKSEFTANTFTPNSQMLPDVLHLSNGGYVVAYNNKSATDGYILLDFYDSDSDLTQPSVRLPYDTIANTSASGAPSMTQLANGDVLVVWNNVDPVNLGIKAARYTASGEKIEVERFLISGLNADAHIEALADGGFVLSYSHLDGIHVAVFGADAAYAVYGTPTVNTIAGATVSNPTCTALANGSIIVTWSSYSAGNTIELHARIVDHTGHPIGGEMMIDGVGHNQVPSIAALPNGNWAVTYADSGWANENGSSGISLKILTPTGANALFGTSTIHVNTPHPQADTRPSVAVLDNGFILVTWNTEVSPNSFDVHGRVFTQTGNPVTVNGISGDLLISSTSGNDTFPDTAALLSGRFITAWTSTDNGGQEIAATVAELIRTTGGDGADDTITGDALRDIISSGGGNDVIDAGAGDDAVNGGAGDDTAVFSHALDQYAVHESAGKFTVSGPDGGTDTLTAIEHFQFADGSVTPDDGSALFDTFYYLSHNPDVFHAGVNALDHFNAVGWHEGRDPNGWFDTSGYLAINKDVAAASINPLGHYHQTGWHEGRDPSAGFDATLYLINNPDVAAAGIDPLEHFLSHGLAEGREGYQAIGQNIAGGFDAEFYLWHNPDVAAAGIDPLFHFNTVGWHEGRNPNGYFDTTRYLSLYTDVAAAGVNPLEHYEQSGWREGRDPASWFDTLGYLAANPDVDAAGMNPLDHYLQFGIYEGREAIFAGLW
jgi:hypothetical protein